MKGYITRIESEARRAAEVITVDEERRKAFVKGAYFAACHLIRITAEHPMEDAAGMTGYLDKLRLKDVRNALSEMLVPVKEDE